MRKILVIIDMQNDFITGALGSEEAAKNFTFCVTVCSKFFG